MIRSKADVKSNDSLKYNCEICIFYVYFDNMQAFYVQCCIQRL